MRSFVDQEGRRWQAVVGKESYGMLVVLFSQDESREVLRSTLRAATRIEAESELAELTEVELRERLAAAEPWG